MAGKAETRARRERIVARAAEVGDDQAAAEAGVTVATLRRWRAVAPVEHQSVSRVKPARHAMSEQAAPSDESEPTGATPEPAVDKVQSLDDVGRMRKAAEAARIVASRAIKRTDELLNAGRASDARNAAAAGGIWADKAAKWDQLILEAEERRGKQAVELAEEQARMLTERTTAMLSALGVPLADDGVRRLVRAALVGEAITAEVAEDARLAVRGAFVSGIRAELGAERQAEQDARAAADRVAELRGLPAPRAPHPDGPAAAALEHEPMTGPVQVAVDAGSAGGRAEAVSGELVEGERHAFAIAYEQVDPDNLDPEAEQAWRTLAKRHALRPELAEHEFKRWWVDRAERYRGTVASRLPWRPSTARADFGHPGMR